MEWIRLKGTCPLCRCKVVDHMQEQGQEQGQEQVTVHERSLRPISHQRDDWYMRLRTIWEDIVTDVP